VYDRSSSPLTNQLDNDSVVNMQIDNKGSYDQMIEPEKIKMVAGNGNKSHQNVVEKISY
jgi:hypothetical protein